MYSVVMMVNDYYIFGRNCSVHKKETVVMWHDASVS